MCQSAHGHFISLVSFVFDSPESRRKIAASLSDDVQRRVIDAGAAFSNTICSSWCAVMIEPSRSEPGGVM